nr:RNA-directed DNA polymerase, eukaryota, reverse transcriptase zinc-binding domain protein [Tanacetum cinerariifolium]
MDSKPSLGLDESCILEYDYSLALKGKVSDFGLLTNLNTVLTKEELLEKFKSHVAVSSWFSSLEYALNSFVIDERVVWVDIEGVPMKIWTNNTFNTISSKWGELLFEEDRKNMSLYKVSGWIPDFLEEDDDEDESDDDTLDNESDGEKTKKTYKPILSMNVTVMRFQTRSLANLKRSQNRPIKLILNREIFNLKTPLISMTCGIVCAWDPRMFHKHNSTISDYFVAIQGDWIPNAKRYLIIFVYAPQEASEKRMLWSYLNHVIERWNGETILMGDFNEVQYKKERFGTIFNNHNALAFNSFFSSSSLAEVPLGGCAFTWCHKSSSKMSKLDRFLISEDTWSNSNISDNNAISKLMKRLRHLKVQTRLSVDHELLNKRVNVMNLLHDLEKLKATEIAQKVKINWSVEEDENFKFFHDGLIYWCDSKKKETMIFKVDFEKAYDSVRWDYLDDVLNKFGFGLKWRNWIHKCLNSSKGSILVNGSPTGEFHFRKGLFNGVSVSSSLHPSHLFYADDVIFMGQWSVFNINILVQALDCFYKASGLRMNLHKSKLMGISVEDELVFREAIKMGCSTLKTPFSYLGIKVGGSMSRIKAWDEIVVKLHACLSKWKMKTLSIGEDIRRKFFIGADLKEKKMSWFKWSRVLASKDKGWFIRAVHGNSGGIETRSRVSYSSTWLTIVNEVNNLRNKSNLLSYMKIKFGNGLNTKLWDDTWMGNKNFKTSFPRIYVLESDKKHAVASKMIHNDVGFSLRRQPRDGVEVEKFRALTTAVEGNLLHARDIEIQNICCPVCNKEVESTNHIFFACSLSRDIYRKIASWWELTYYEFQDYEEWLAWIFSLRTSSKQKELPEGIYNVTWWLVWNHRNKSIFDSRSPSKAIIFDDLVSRSFYWCEYRCKARFSWLEWIKNLNLITL